MAAFRFPARFMANGKNWRLVYEPGNELTPLPDLAGARVDNLVCDVVPVPGPAGQSGPLHVVRVDLTLPGGAGGGRVVGQRHLRGIRAFPVRPASIDTVPPAEMAIYLEEPSAQGAVGETEGFVMGLLGVALEEQKPDVDTEWAGRLLTPAADAAPAGADPAGDDER